MRSQLKHDKSSRPGSHVMPCFLMSSGITLRFLVKQIQASHAKNARAYVRSSLRCQSVYSGKLSDRRPNSRSPAFRDARLCQFGISTPLFQGTQIEITLLGGQLNSHRCLQAVRTQVWKSPMMSYFRTRPLYGSAMCPPACSLVIALMWAGIHA